MVYDKVVEIISDQLGIDKDNITSETNLVDDLGADSLDIVSLIMAMEEEFGLEFPEDEADSFQTVGDVVEYISNNAE